jgi:hypothetical protein
MRGGTLGAKAEIQSEHKRSETAIFQVRSKLNGLEQIRGKISRLGWACVVFFTLFFLSLAEKPCGNPHRRTLQADFFQPTRPRKTPIVTLKLNLCKKSKDFIVVSGFAESPGFKPLVFDPGDS